MSQILVVDDEVGIRELLSEILRRVTVSMKTKAGEQQLIAETLSEAYALTEIFDFDPVNSTTFWASSSMVNSPGLPRFTGPVNSSPLFMRSIRPSTVSST